MHNQNKYLFETDVKKAMNQFEFQYNFSSLVCILILLIS